MNQCVDDYLDYITTTGNCRINSTWHCAVWKQFSWGHC